MATPTNVPVARASEGTTLTVGEVKPRTPEPAAHPEGIDEQGRLSLDINKSDSDSIAPSVSFAPKACLFCPQASSSFDANITHMQKLHGLFIPHSIDDGELQLAVDPEVLVEYMHLVIFGYHECLFCGTQRTDGWAARQHMIGKGHCRIDVAAAGSEWRDFYGSDDHFGLEDEDGDGLDDDLEGSSRGRHEIGHGASLRLPSGKVIMNRAAPAPKSLHHKPLAEGTRRHNRRGGNLILDDFITTQEQPSSSTSSHKVDETNSSSSVDTAPRPSSSTSPAQVQTLTRADRRRLLTANRSALTVATDQMSKHDRAALAHFSPAERRATILGQFKQQERVQTGERKYWSKFERRQDRPAEGGKVYIGGG